MGGRDDGGNFGVNKDAFSFSNVAAAAAAAAAADDDDDDDNESIPAGCYGNKLKKKKINNSDK